MAYSSLPQHKLCWYMLKETLLDVNVNLEIGKTQCRHVVAGTIFCGYDLPLHEMSTKNITLRSEKEKYAFSMSCQRKMLIKFDDEDVKWLLPMRYAKDRITVYNDQLHWLERTKIKAGIPVNYTTTVSNLKGKAIVTSVDYSDMHGGYRINIQMKQKGPLFGTKHLAALSEIRVTSKTKPEYQAVHTPYLKIGDRVVLLDDGDSKIYGKVTWIGKERGEEDILADVEFDREKNLAGLLKNKKERMLAETLIKAADFEDVPEINGNALLKKNIQSKWTFIIYSGDMQIIFEKVNMLSAEGQKCVEGQITQSDKYRMFLCQILLLKGEKFEKTFDSIFSNSPRLKADIYKEDKGLPKAGTMHDEMLEIPSIKKSIQDNKRLICNEVFAVSVLLDKMFQDFAIPVDIFINILSCKTNCIKRELLLNFLIHSESLIPLNSFIEHLQTNNKDTYRLIIRHANSLEAPTNHLDNETQKQSDLLDPLWYKVDCSIYNAVILEGKNEFAAYILDINHVVDYLVKNGVLDTTQSNRILHIEDKYGKMDKLLSLLVGCENYFPTFARSLQATNNRRAYSYLEEQIRKKESTKIKSGANAETTENYGSVLYSQKAELVPLLTNESEILIASLESKNILSKSQTQKLMQTENTYKRIGQLFELLATRDAFTLKSLIEVLEENGDRRAANLLLEVGKERFPGEFTTEQNDNQETPVEKCAEEDRYRSFMWKKRYEIVPAIEYSVEKIINTLKNNYIISETLTLDKPYPENALALLNIIGNLGEEGFNGFTVALDECSHESLATYLRLKKDKYFGPQKTSTLGNMKKTLGAMGTSVKNFLAGESHKNLNVEHHNEPNLAQDTRKGPKFVAYKEAEDILGFRVGSRVVVGDKGGVIRWIGHASDPQKPIAGLEMDERHSIKMGKKPGELYGFKLFNCQPGRDKFINLELCQLDESLINPEQATMSDWENVKAADVVRVSPTPYTFTGEMMGIEGRNESCYVDATLFCLFASNDSLDFILEQDNSKLATHLRENIVNKLRINHLVPAKEVTKILEKLTDKKNYVKKEKDPAEFVTFLLTHAMTIDPLLQFSNGQNMFLMKIASGRDTMHIPTTQKLMNMFCWEFSIKMEMVPKCLIMQLPRNGKQKVYDRIFTSPKLILDDVLQHAKNKCIFCNQAATRRCDECAQTLFARDKAYIVFCNDCNAKRHNNELRKNHNMVHTIPTDDSKSTLEPKSMELFAVLCKTLNNCVAFVKFGKEVNSPWVFFNSLAEKDEGSDPEVRESKAVTEWLNNDNGYKTLIQAELGNDSQKFFGDPYMCFYRPAYDSHTKL